MAIPRAHSAPRQSSRASCTIPKWAICSSARSGAFVEFAPGKDGMIHISKLSNHRVEKVEDVLSIGDTVKVEIIKIGEKGIDFKLLEKLN